MFELPLFPLNTVLFPGMPLHLHIFEERYKQMINRCLDEQAPFGVVLIQHGMEALGPLAKPHKVGCLAQIVQMEKLEEGRMNIAAIGGQRFQIHQLYEDRYPYLAAEAELFPVPAGEEAAQQQALQRLYPLVKRYVSILVESGQSRLDLDKLPDDPATFAYLAVMLLQIPAKQKQPLLETASTVHLLEALQPIFQREIALLRDMLDQPASPPIAGRFTLN